MPPQVAFSERSELAVFSRCSPPTTYPSVGPKLMQLSVRLAVTVAHERLVADLTRVAPAVFMRSQVFPQGS